MDRDEAEELLRTLFADPGAARATAEAVLVTDDDPAVSSIGHQIIGIVLRDLGHADVALHELRTALRLARRSGDTARAGDVLATLGASLCLGGRTTEGLRLLGEAEAALHGVPLGRMLVRRALVLGHLLARFEDSASDLRRARELFAGSGDHVWEARALNLQGLVDVNQGDIESAERAFAEYGVLAAEVGDGEAVAVSVHNRGWLAFVRGDLPEAMERFADAAARFEGLGVTNVDLVFDQASAYLAGGLAEDAVAIVEAALVARPLQGRERADLLIGVAEAALAAGDSRRAMSAADEGAAMLRAQARPVHRLEAELLSITARDRAGQQPGPLLRRAERVVAGLRDARAPQLPHALLLGAGLASRVRSARAAGLASDWLAEAASFRQAPTGAVRALGWFAQARARDLLGDSGGVLRACELGLRALDEHRATLGSQELRAGSAGHGAALAELGTRTAMASGDARQLLRWSERWRATALSTPARSAGHDEETAADLTALRAQRRRLDEARSEGAPTDALEARATRLEQTVRRRLLQERGSGEAAATLDVEPLLAALTEDDTVLVELTELDGVLHALVAGRGRVRHRVVGDAAAAAAAVDFSLFTLRQAARGRRAQLEVAGGRLERALLGAALDGLGEQRVVVCAPAALQGVPWGLLPSLAHGPVTGTPSARLWLRARTSAPADDRRVMLVGPGLGSGGAEVPAVAAEDPRAEVLDGEAATVSAALAALDGVALAHVAAHGHFREDSPLFSSLTLADGPLLVHDLQGLGRPPHRVVLSACESGVMQPVGDQELLGLAAALLSMGTAGVVSSLAEVDDAATVDVMVALHARLRQGGGLGDAMLAAREAAAGDSVLAATAASFTVLGI
ncbi:CHAT domain-containing protein [Nocardioides cavernae]|uniref:CHAT domain-containing protein n=1 Tax=Nocardioides cavernae TaxID=1921566 RepID=A0ABR8NFM6_9ACTN|nr:CHAT domain-containing protein [Nocardioides cavernae]MBD3926912.1 CHAT domain-containing protein [Nocardioides cavernae]MBM7512633.1 tetratricopeptide (TPR) repeat protein [Nocardioides cavernae]